MHARRLIYSHRLIDTQTEKMDGCIDRMILASLIEGFMAIQRDKDVDEERL